MPRAPLTRDTMTRDPLLTFTDRGI
ncbi:MAG: hypothetical protein RIR62_886, partial [Pseudomonadota bacterium]